MYSTHIDQEASIWAQRAGWQRRSMEFTHIITLPLFFSFLLLIQSGKLHIYIYIYI